MGMQTRMLLKRSRPYAERLFRMHREEILKMAPPFDTENRQWRVAYFDAVGEWPEAGGNETETKQG